MTKANPRVAAMRIVVFSSVDLSLPQGHALHLRGLLDALSDRGHSVALVTPRPKGTPPSTRFERLETRRPGWGALSLLGFEVVGGFRLWGRCRRDRPDAIYVRQDIYTLAAAFVARKLHLPLVVEINASVTEELALQGHEPARRVAAFCERFTLRRADRVLVLAPEHGVQLAGRTGIDPDRIRVVPIGTRLPERTDPDQTRRAQEVGPETFVVGFAGNLSRIQGVDLLISALREIPVPDVQLWIIGCGDEERRLREQGRGDSGRIRFFGGVPREESESLLSACHLLIAPYRRPDYDRVSGGGALSSKILTYLAADRPILMSDIPGYQWLSEIGAGSCVAVDGPLPLARAIEERYSLWRAAGMPSRDWPWNSPGPGVRFVEQGRTWDDAAVRVESILVELTRPVEAADRGPSRGSAAPF
jgi:glycosyltransferase involved in cell wall biosynthesis